MATVIDLFRHFHRTSINSKFRGSVKLVYYTLLGIYNEEHRPEKICVTNRYVAELTGLAVSTVNDCLKFLAQNGFISYTRKNNSTWITLKDNLAFRNEQRAKSKARKAEQKANVHAREENKSSEKEAATASIGIAAPTKDKEILGLSLSELIRKMS